MLLILMLCVVHVKPENHECLISSSGVFAAGGIVPSPHPPDLPFGKKGTNVAE